MASIPKPKPTTSRWGFLSQAVASVESKLDTILADEEEPVKQNNTPPQPADQSIQVSRSSQDSTRNNAASQNNDRLQERLARAMAKKTAGRPDTLMNASESGSRPSTPTVAESEPPPPSSNHVENETASQDDAFAKHLTGQMNYDGPTDTITTVPPSEHQETKISDDEVRPTPLLKTSASDESETRSVDQRTIPSASALATLNDAATLSQAEVQTYVERIDALNAKLQYLAQEVIKSSREPAANLENGGMTRKLAEKDEKIANLMEEGNKLSMTEMKNLTMIKKLRAQNAALIREQTTTQTRFASIEKQLSTAVERSRLAHEEAQKLRGQMLSSTKSDKDFEAIFKERSHLQQTVTELKVQVVQAHARAERAEASAQDEKLELSKLRVIELEAELANMKIALEQSERNLNQQIEKLRQSLQSEKESSLMMESEMLAEQAILEGRLESFKIKAEEASSADDRDIHARLMRQIEVLQGQYATASQNWQGIEGSLLSRITTLEHDRDEIAAREADVRKKVRDATLKCKTAEKELDDLQARINLPSDGPPDKSAEVLRLTDKIEQLERNIVSSRKDAEAQKERMERDFAKKLEEERAKAVPLLQQARLEFPTPSSRKTSTYAVDQLMSPSHALTSRRSSALPSIMSDVPRRYSTSGKGLANGVHVETPSIVASPDDDYFDDLPGTPLSQDRQQTRRGLNDVMSTSTVGAGVSVQLIERMSANVRRLESEKSASKDEIARITSQRDEARQEIVQLMRDVEQKVKTDIRLKELEEQLADLSTRHQTTLEILGEKSEQVGELKQDIADVKQMYRDLADHMK